MTSAVRRAALARDPDWYTPSGQKLHLVRPGREPGRPMTYCGRDVVLVFSPGANPDPPDCTLCLRFERAAIRREQ
jgi:hypothetical protein